MAWKRRKELKMNHLSAATERREKALRSNTMLLRELPLTAPGKQKTPPLARFCDL
jgi:hypothetical protein